MKSVITHYLECEHCTHTYKPHYNCIDLVYNAVVDPGFPPGRGGLPTTERDFNLLFGIIFAENCMKIKTI